MSGQRTQPVTELLTRWKAGDATALEALIPIVYDELHRLAHHYLRGERHGHTLQSTALVNEAYLRLVSHGAGEVGDRTHFLGVAAHVMRQILVDHARAERAAKRDGGRRVVLEEALHPLQVEDIDVIDLDKALEALERLDSEKSPYRRAAVLRRPVDRRYGDANRPLARHGKTRVGNGQGLVEQRVGDAVRMRSRAHPAPA